METAALAPDGAVTRLNTAALAVKMASAPALAVIRVMSRLTALAEKMARPAREVPLEIVVLSKDTAARQMSSVLLVVSPTLDLVLLKLMFRLTASVARTARYAKAANTVIAVPQRDTVAKMATVGQDVSLSLVHALLRLTSLPTVSAVRMARSAKGARMVTAALPRATAARRRAIVTLDVRVPLVPATMLLATFPRTVSVVRMERLARAARSATAALPKAGAERRRIIVARVASPALALVMPQLVMSLLMVAAARMAKSARVVSGATVAPRTATVGRTMVTAVMDVRRHTVSVLEFPLMPSAVQEMARRVLALVLETAVLPTGSAGALQPTAVRAGKFLPLL